MIIRMLHPWDEPDLFFLAHAQHELQHAACAGRKSPRLILHSVAMHPIDLCIQTQYRRYVNRSHGSPV